MTFRVGQRVVLVDNTPNRSMGQTIGDFPRLNCVYTVAKVFLSPYKGIPSIHLVEVGERGQVGYYARRFRPLVERKTDISWAHKIVRDVKTGKPQPVPMDLMDLWK